MITSNMTNSELVAEFEKQVLKIRDQVEAQISILVHKEIKKDLKNIKASRRRNYFKIKSRAILFDHNEWHLFFYCVKKGFKVRYLCRIEDHVKKMSKYIYLDDDQNIKIYSGHFFSRYKSRFLSNFGDNISRSDLLGNFFMYDNISGEIYFDNVSPNRELTSEVYEVYHGGIGLGSKDFDNNLIEFNTFVSYDNLKKSQLVLLQENMIIHYGKLTYLNKNAGEKNRVDRYLWDHSLKTFKLGMNQIEQGLKKYNIDPEAHKRKLIETVKERGIKAAKAYAKEMQDDE
jgi:hypothetical protein